MDIGIRGEKRKKKANVLKKLQSNNENSEKQKQKDGKREDASYIEFIHVFIPLMSHPLFIEHLPSARLYVVYYNIDNTIGGKSEWKKEQSGKEVWELFMRLLDIPLAQRVPESEASAQWDAAGCRGRWPGYLHTERCQS